MAVNGVFSTYVTGSVADIRKQAEAIRQRATAQREARIAEQDKTGLIQDPKTGEMVELSSISEETRAEWNDRLEMKSLSIGEVALLFKDADPNLETVERSKELGKVYAKLQNKMFTGKLLTSKEISWLRENDYAWLASTAERAVAEAEELKSRLARCKSNDEAHKVYINAKSRLVGGADKSDSAILFLSPALDETYSHYLKYGTSKTSTVDIWA